MWNLSIKQDNSFQVYLVAILVYYFNYWNPLSFVRLVGRSEMIIFDILPGPPLHPTYKKNQKTQNFIISEVAQWVVCAEKFVRTSNIYLIK
jgi:hypothetical protein